MSILESGNYITAEIIQTYQDVVVGLRNDLGRYVTLILPPNSSGCSNCQFDSIRRTSAGIYNSGNSFPINGPYHRVFSDGQTCPVCVGKGVINIPQSGVYKASIRWVLADEERPGIFSREMGKIGNVPNADVKIKISVSGHSDLQRCLGAIIDGQYCVLAAQPIARGLGPLFLSVVYFNRKE